MTTEAVLHITGLPDTLRPGTATATVWKALAAVQGQPRSVVLIALAIAETSWHAGGNRAVQGIRPAGWLRKFEEHIEWVESDDTESE